MAVKEAKILIAMITQRFALRFDHDNQDEPEGFFGIILFAHNGMPMTVARK